MYENRSILILALIVLIALIAVLAVSGAGAMLWQLGTIVVQTFVSFFMALIPR